MLVRRRKTQGPAAAAAAAAAKEAAGEAAPEAGGQALVPYSHEASQKADRAPEDVGLALGPEAEAQRASLSGPRVQQRLFENGFLAAKMSRARKMHTLMARLVGALLWSAVWSCCSLSVVRLFVLVLCVNVLMVGGFYCVKPTVLADGLCKVLTCGSA